MQMQLSSGIQRKWERVSEEEETPAVAGQTEMAPAVAGQTTPLPVFAEDPLAPPAVEDSDSDLALNRERIADFYFLVLAQVRLVDSLSRHFPISDDLALNRELFAGLQQVLTIAWELRECLIGKNILGPDLEKHFRDVDRRVGKVECHIRTRELKLRPVLMQLG